MRQGDPLKATPGPARTRAPAPPAPPEGGPAAAPEAKSPFGKAEATVVENVEALAIAVVMALVIRHYSVEAFKIPTDSMKPTLFGDTKEPQTNRVLVGGDRILVDKTAYQYGGEPRRWDVVVFRYPLNVAKNFIKRLVGLPGEHVEIRNADIFVNGAIQRKPARIQEAVWIPLEAPGGRLPTVGRVGPWTVPNRGARKEEESLRITGEADVRVAADFGPDNEFLLTNQEQCRAWDVRLSMKARVEGTGGLLKVRIGHPGRGQSFTAVLPSEGAASDAGIEVPEGSAVEEWERREPGFRLKPGRLHRVAFHHADAALALRVDGQVVAAVRVAPPVRFEPSESAASTLDLWASKGTNALIQEARLFRDIHYESKGASDVTIPDGHYFMLGDNSRFSKDSRLWDLLTVRLPDGSIRKGEYEDLEGGFHQVHRVFVDQFGNEWPPTVEKELSRERYPFVPRKGLIGRAFFVFWPVWPEFRPKFIR